MAVSEVEAVLEYLRSNGFFNAESALIEDLADQGDRLLASFDFEKFIFPMLPLPPPVRIPARPSTADDGDRDGERSSGSSSDDQFMSLGSSTSEVASSSDFVNPYGLQSSSTPDSETSSGRMSQFGTARTYNDFDFDMQNDLYLYDEKSDEGHFLTPCYRVPDPFLGPTEDKFIMSSEVNVSKESGEEEDHEIGELVDLDDGYWEQTDVNGLETKNFENMDVSENNASSGKDLLAIDSRNFVIRDSGEDWFDKPKLDLSPTEELMGKDAMSNEDLGNDVEVTEELDQGGESRDDALMLEGLEDEDYEVFELRIVHRKNKTGFEENKEFPIVLNTIIAGRYYVTEYLGSAAFSKVLQAHDLHTGMDVCLKIIKNDKDFFDQSLDEIKLLKLVNKHDPGDERHILRLYDYFYHQEHLFIVCELLRANLYEFQKFNQESGGEAYFTLDRLQVITRQCLEALDYLHGLGIIHCDLKPENILIKSYRRSEIKIIDLGSSCFGSDSLCLYVQSRSYRAPEVILGLPYDHKIDIWSLGCILAELCSGEVLFPNDAVVMILSRMIGMFGPIDLKMLLRGQETSKYFTEEYDLYFVNEEKDQVEFIIPEESSLERHLGVSDVGFIDFLKCLLEMNPKRRPTAKEALEHPWLSPKYTCSC